MFTNAKNVPANLIAMSLVAAITGSAGAAVSWLGGAPSIPDYYQHQLGNPGRAVSPNPLPVPTAAVPGAPNYAQDAWWEGRTRSDGVRVGGGWCGTTAWVNALKYWDDHGYRGLIDRSAQGGAHADKNWLEQFTYSNGSLALTQNATDGGCAWVSAVRSYVRANTATDQNPGGVDPTIRRYKWNSTPGRVETITGAEGTEYDPAIAGAAQGTFTTMWDILTTAVSQGFTAVVKIGESPNNAPNGDSNNGHWWGNFHVLTLAGVDGALGTNARAFLADPNDSYRGGAHSAGWGVPYAATDALPMGADFYASITIGADGRTFTSGAYNGSAIDQIWLMQVPAPGSTVLAGLGLLLAARRRRA
ncbi:hypothetical protein PHYC_00929 [Phycisphaerales bacterium]|nr:hypothetical protein PHYC_00929 [Phycisphaerales bacterium]